MLIVSKNQKKQIDEKAKKGKKDLKGKKIDVPVL